MGAWMVQIVAAVFILGGAVGYDLVRSTRKPPMVNPVPSYPDAVSYRAQIVGLPDASDAAETLATNATALYKTYRDSVAAVEGKIGTLLGYVGGGTGILALLSGTDKITKPTLTPLIVVSVIALLAVVFFSLEGLRPQGHLNPNVADLCDITLLRSMSGNTRMNAITGWENLEAARQMVPIVHSKGAWLKRCYLAFAVGVIALVANVLIPIPSTNTTTSITVPFTCDVSSGKMANCAFTITGKSP
jgi:hypothetical protein